MTGTVGVVSLQKERDGFAFYFLAHEREFVYYPFFFFFFSSFSLSQCLQLSRQCQCTIVCVQTSLPGASSLLSSPWKSANARTFLPRNGVVGIVKFDARKQEEQEEKKKSLTAAVRCHLLVRFSSSCISRSRTLSPINNNS